MSLPEWVGLPIVQIIIHQVHVLEKGSFNDSNLKITITEIVLSETRRENYSKKEVYSIICSHSVGDMFT